MSNYLKTNTRLTPADLDGIDAAAEHAASIGYPLNALLSIHVSHTVGPMPWRACREWLQDLLTKWVKTHLGIPLVAVWVAEAPKRDIHIHWLLHIPNRRALKALRQYVHQHLAPEDPRPDQMLKPLDRSPKAKPERTPLAGALDYLKKGERDLAQGTIKGKRWNCTRNIGPAVRERWRTGKMGEATEEVGELAA